MSTELSTQSQAQAGGLTMYDRVDPLEFVEKIGSVFHQSGAGGCKSPAEGKLLALACLSEQKSVFDIAREYHLMDGKLAMKADIMLARFRAMGGKHKWIHDGGDGQRAELLLIDGDEESRHVYTIDDAKRAGLVKDGSNWVKRPAAMLRARCISENMGKFRPEIRAGFYTPEEVEDLSVEQQPQTTSRPSAADLIRRQQQAEATVEASDTVIDAEVTTPDPPATSEAPEATKPPAAPSDDDVPFDVPEPTEPEAKRVAAILDVERLLEESGVMTREQLEASIKAKNSDFTSIDDLELDAVKKLYENLKAKINKTREKEGQPPIV